MKKEKEKLSLLIIDFIIIIKWMELNKLYGLYCSVRVSNELGAAHPRTAKFSVVVAVVTSFITGLLLALILLVFRNQYPSVFSIDTQVKTLVKQLTPLLAISIVVNNIQPTLSGKWIFNFFTLNLTFCYFVWGQLLTIIVTVQS